MTALRCWRTCGSPPFRAARRTPPAGAIESERASRSDGTPNFGLRANLRAQAAVACSFPIKSAAKMLRVAQLFCCSTSAWFGESCKTSKARSESLAPNFQSHSPPTHTHLANSPRVEQIAFATNGTPVMKLPALQLPRTNSFLEFSHDSHALPDEVEWIVLLPSPPGWKRRRTGKSVYTIGVQLNNDAEAQLFQIISVPNQNGENLGIAYQKALNGVKRIIMLNRRPGTNSIHLKLAIPKIETFEFIARPEFVE